MCVCVFVQVSQTEEEKIGTRSSSPSYAGKSPVSSSFRLNLHLYVFVVVAVVVVVCHQRGSREWRRELAALVIQLAWRQYQRRQVLARALRRQRILHDWTPSVMAARQKALVQKVYSKSLHSLSRPFFRG